MAADSQVEPDQLLTPRRHFNPVHWSPDKCLQTGGQDPDCLGDVAVGGGGADAEPDRELGVGVTLAQMGQGEQSLPTDAQAPPSGADLLAASAPAEKKSIGLKKWVKCKDKHW